MKPAPADLRGTHVAARASTPPHRGGPLSRHLNAVRNTSDMHSNRSERKRPPADPIDADRAKRTRGDDPLDTLIDNYRRYRGSSVQILNGARSLLEATTDPRACRELFARIEEKLHAVGMHLNRNHFKVLIRACQRGNDMDLAWEAFRSMQAHKPAIPGDRELFNTLITGFGKSGDSPRIAELTDEMAKLGLEPDAVTYSGEMNAYANAGKPHHAERVLDYVRSKDASLLTEVHWNIAIKGYEMANQPGHSWRLIQAMQAHDPSVETGPVLYGKVLRSCARTGDWKTAWAIKLRMESQPRPVRFNHFIWETLLQSFKNGGHPEGAEAVLRCMERSPIQPGVEDYGVVIAGYHDARRSADALRLLQEAVEVGVVAQSAGYNRFLNTMDLHRSAVAGNPRLQHGRKGVPAGMAATLLAWLHGRGTFNDKTEFVVGQGEGLVAQAVLAALEQWGKHYTVSARNPGRLVPA